MQTKVLVGIAVLLVVAISVGALFALRFSSSPEVAAEPTKVEQKPVSHIIGKSVEGRDITAITYGTGSTNLVFVGGIHGGYEWNSVSVAYLLKDYLDMHPEAVPASESVTIIPDANPDAVFKAIGKEGAFDITDVPQKDLSAERFNAHDVDLNRNFDCKWASAGTWQNKTVSGGTAAFSEPESAAIRDYALSNRPAAFIFWHSASGAVYASQCGNGILPKTLDVLTAYADASGYPAVKEFTAYEVHGASEDWLASVGIPAITVELSSHDALEWEQNFKGVEAVLKLFSKNKEADSS